MTISRTHLIPVTILLSALIGAGLTLSHTAHAQSATDTCGPFTASKAVSGTKTAVGGTPACTSRANSLHASVNCEQDSTYTQIGMDCVPYWDGATWQAICSPTYGYVYNYYAGTGAIVAGTASQSAATCPYIPDPVLNSFTATPLTVSYGGSVQLSWSSSNATSCSSSDFNTNNAANGIATVVVKPPVGQTSKTYTISCSDPYKSVSKSVTVTVTNVPASPSCTAWDSTKIGTGSLVGGTTFTTAADCQATCQAYSATNGVTVTCGRETDWYTYALSGVNNPPEPSANGGTTNDTCAIRSGTGTGAGSAHSEDKLGPGSDISSGGYHDEICNYDAQNNSTCTYTGAWPQYYIDPNCAQTEYCWSSSQGYDSHGATTCTYTPPVTPAPTVTLTASQTSIISGGSSTLTWSSTNATSCSPGTNFSTGGATSGTRSVTPGSTTTYSLTCTGAGGTSAPASATVTVTPTLTASCSVLPTSINPNGSATWTATPSGGNGVYTYSWTGTDSLTGSTQSVAKTYSTSGTKTASVTVTSGSQTTAPIPCSNSLTVNTLPPNLTAGAITPTSATAGTPVMFSATISNIGSGGTGTGFTDLFQRATDALGTGATDIGTYANAALGANSSNTATLSYNFLSAGTYYVRACADKSSAGDVNGAIVETSDGDNCGAWTAVTVAAAPAPDLTAGSVSPTSATANTSVTLSAIVSNLGNATTGTGFTDLFQRATDALGTGATDIGTYSSAAIAATGSNTATLPYTFTSAGTPYIRVCADKSSAGDVNGVITESDPGNNCGGWTAVTVSGPAPATITSCTPSSLTATPNQNVTWTVSVSGFSPAPTTYAWTATGGNPASGPGSSNTFTTKFASGGAYAPTVTASNSTQSAGPTSCTPVTISGSGNSCGTGVTATISANPTRVVAGGTSTITYGASGVAAGTTCTLSGQGAPAHTAAADASCNISAGSFGTGVITAQSVYTITCPGATAQTAVVNVIPTYKEF